MNHRLDMKVSFSFLVWICCMIGSVFSVQSETVYDASRYELIIEREPFGKWLWEPTVLRVVALAQAAAQAAEKELRLCFIFETNQGEIRAGFQNKTAKPGDPKSIMLGVGESFRGMKLLAVNLEESSATLDRDGVRVNFSLAKAPTPVTKNTTVAAPRRFGSGFQSPEKPSEPKPPLEPQLSPEQQAQRRAEIQENLRQYQMEVLRTGMPPLPIPLTKEMDDQLVSEGILPPAN